MPVVDTGRVFDIYSVGDGEFMRRVIDSVAAMSNTGLLLQLVGFGLLLGLLIMGFRNVMYGGNKLDLGTTLVAFILGSVMFGLKADVMIHDMNFAPGEIDQPVYRVDNVPFGIAAAGYIISGTGFTLTEQMETGYGLYAGGRSSLIEGGFGNTLEWINSIRMWEVPTFNDAGQEVGRFRENVGTYINECTLPAIEMGHLKYDAILQSTTLYTMGNSSGGGGFGYASEYLMFEYTESNGTKTVQTCGQGFADIVADSGSVMPQFAAALGRSELGMSSEGNSSQQAMENAFSAIGVNTAQMQDLVLAELVGMSLHNAVSGKTSATALSTQTRMMVEQASLQRSVQWAAEETMFRRVMRPMMAFFEALIYALAPFMALMIGLGSFGIQTVMKYLMLSIWVILWLPMLSIIQLYQITMMQHAVTGLQNSMDGMSTGLGSSVAGAEQMRTLAIDWLGTGAAMAAFTPALTMALVWGGAVTASALAGKMGGGDHVNEKTTAPDGVSTAPAMQAGSGWNASRATGATSQDSLAAQPMLNTSAVTGFGESSKISQLQTAQTQWAAAVQQALSDTYGTSAGFGATSGKTHAGGGTASDVSSWGSGSSGDASTGVDAARAGTVTRGGTKKDDTTISATGGLEIAGIGGTARKSGSDTQVQEVSDLVRAARTGGGRTGTNANESSGETFAQGQRAEEAVAALARKDANFAQALARSQTYGQAQTALDQSQKGFEQTGSFEQRYGSQQSVPVAQAAQDYLSKGGAGDNGVQAANAVQAAQTLGLGGEAKAAADSLFKGIANSDQRQTAGAMYALYQAAQRPGAYGMSESEGKEAGARLNEMLSGGPMDMAGFMSGAVKPNTNAGMAMDVPDRDALRQDVGNNAVAPTATKGLISEVNGALTAGSPTQAGYASDVQGVVPTNPGAYGPGIMSADAAEARAEKMGGAAIEGVRKDGFVNAAEASAGMAEMAKSDTADNTTMDLGGTMTWYAGNFNDPSTGNAAQVEGRMEGLRQSNEDLSEGQMQYLAVGQELAENGSTHVTQSQYLGALQWARENPEELQEVTERYGSERSGAVTVIADGIRAEADGGRAEQE